MEFEFDVTQQASCHFIGKLIIEANNKEEAIEKIKVLSFEELGKLCIEDEWEQSNNIIADGEIEVYDENGDIIR